MESKSRQFYAEPRGYYDDAIFTYLYAPFGRHIIFIDPVSS